MTTVREYRLLASGLPEAQKLAIKRYLVPQLLICVAVVLVSCILATRRATVGTAIAFAVFAALFIEYYGFISPRRLRRNLTKCWDTYVLTIGPDYLLRQQADAPDIRLPFDAVRGVEYLPGRYLRVIGSGKYKVIGISESIESFEEVLGTVSKIAPLANPKRDRSLKQFSVMASGFAAYMVMLWSHSPLVVLPLALIVSGYLIWLFVYMQRSPNVLRRSKRASRFYLLFTVICVLKVLEVLG